MLFNVTLNDILYLGWSRGSRRIPRQGAAPDRSDSAQAGDVPLQRTLHDLRVALNEQADAAAYPDVGALVAGARRAVATRRRRLTVLGVTTAAVLVVSGLIAIGGTTTSPPPSRGATATPPAGATPVYRTAVVVNGTRTCSDLTDYGTYAIRADGSMYNRNGRVECTDTSSDPRVAGTEVETFDSVRWGEFGTTGTMIVRGTVRLTNAGGSWVGVDSGMFDFVTGETHTRWCAGTGGYAGLSYFFSIASGGDTTKTHGLIFPGTFPPKP